MRAFKHRPLLIPQDTPERIALAKYVHDFQARTLYLNTHSCSIWQRTRQVETGVCFAGYQAVSYLELETRPYEIWLLPEPQILWLDCVMPNRLGCRKHYLRLHQLAQYSEIIAGRIPL